MSRLWSQYLGEFQPTSEEHNGTRVYVNSGELFLYVNDNGDWSANTVINDRGVLRGTDKAAAPCLAAVTRWRYWDGEHGKWEPADISTTCGEHGILHILIYCLCGVEYCFKELTTATKAEENRAEEQD